MVDDFDVVVVEGGINGTGLARDLAGRGWRVLLAERDDLASHTSSASTSSCMAAALSGHLRLLVGAQGRVARACCGQARELLAAPAGAEIAPGLFESELHHLVEGEWATTAEDVLWRRSKLGLHCTAEQRDAVANWFKAGT